MTFIERAGLLEDVIEAGFQYKNGAAFLWKDHRFAFDFRQKFTKGWGTTYQVQRAPFDKLLADGAAKQGADIRYGHEAVGVDVSDEMPTVTVRSPEETYTLRGKFLVDASGYGRVLPKFLNLETTPPLPPRRAMFTHIEDNIGWHAMDLPGVPFEREKIRITVHPAMRDVWYWLIPFSNGRTSFGVVGGQEQINDLKGNDPMQLKAWADQAPDLARLLKDAKWDTPVRELIGYSKNVKNVCGNGNWCLLGNSGEFLDPVFSSGVTIAFKSADLAMSVLNRQLDGEQVDWIEDYAKPLQKGVDVFQEYVQAWYDGRLQDLIFMENKLPRVVEMISAVLAGYAWDEQNPFVARAAKKLTSTHELLAM
jgi:flavin-dependent dehydrogenase